MSDETNRPNIDPENGEAAPADGAAGAPTPEAETGGASEAPGVDALQGEIEELKDKLLRAMAETENVRRRAERDRADAARYGASSFGRDMLAIADNLRRAIDALPAEARTGAPDAARTLIEGVEVTERALLAAFERHGIRPVSPEVGERFDPNLHEAMFEVPGTGQPSGTVVQVVETGYMMGDRLLRAARVGVARNEDEAKAGGHIDTRI